MMGRFRYLLDDLDLKEIPLLGRKYTRSNEGLSPTLFCLDRVFCFSDWEDIFLECLLQSLAYVVSDHCPLTAGLKVKVHGKRRFFFESFGPNLDGFKTLVEESWGTHLDSVCPVEQFYLKLLCLNKGLQKWSRKVGNVKLQLDMAKEILHRLEIARDLQ
uniref:Endonuclease/exonuclease/phosphatase domain-containing protein n=1 Tax=Oryza brachyantha TaxID=4533 RepID=J3MDH4_ORYBR